MTTDKTSVPASPPVKHPRLKILYGVQGTGNGHISRASAMNKAMVAQGNFDVTWVMSGRDKSPLMCCDHYDWYRGMTFMTRDGRIKVLETLAGNNPWRFLKDARGLCLAGYDRIITDFEPVVARAARLQGIQALGIGHQYAFAFSVPVARGNRLSRKLMDWFAPAEEKIGLHWHHFDQPILPPIVDMHGVSLERAVIPGKVLVYLPFENQDALVQMCRCLPQWQFHIYAADMVDYNLDNIHTRAISRTGFKNDLVSASAVITNSGFELISECLTLGKRILTKPLQGQVEQLSNARALAELGYATVIDTVDEEQVRKWLGSDVPVWQVQYPDVAAAIARWIAEPGKVSVQTLATDLWEQTKVRKVC